MKYNVGDKVRIKSEDWYKQMLSIPNKLVWQNKLTNDFVGVWCGSHIFKKSMFEFLGKTMTIQEVGIDFYLMEEDTCGYEFTDEMIEGLVEEEAKSKIKFKVGDEVRIKATDIVGTVESIIRGHLIVNYKDSKMPVWPEDVVLMESVEDEISLDKAGQITDFEYEGLTYTLPDGYQFVDENGNVINATKIVLEKKKKEYPKTYEECCEILGIIDDKPLWRGYRSVQLKILQKLLICRDAYWKIAGEEMGLGEPWEPDWMNNLQHKHYISTEWDEIKINFNSTTNKVLAFPTAEMRDAFYENFKELINECKELL